MLAVVISVDVGWSDNGEEKGAGGECADLRHYLLIYAVGGSGPVGS